MAGVSRDKRREKERAEVDLISPHGTEITVGAKRAKALLERPPIRLGDGTSRRYVEADSGESNVVEAPTTGAQAPRKGSGANSGGA